MSFAGRELADLIIGGGLAQEQPDQQSLEPEHSAGVESLDKLRLRDRLGDASRVAVRVGTGAGIFRQQRVGRERARADV